MSTLLISGVVSSDYASYICEAKNTEGFQSQTAKLSGKRKYFFLNYFYKHKKY